MPIAAPRRSSIISLSVATIKEALDAEREFTKSGIAVQIERARFEKDLLILGVTPVRHKGRRSAAIEETLEGSRAVWGPELQHRGEVVVVNAETAEIVVRWATGPAPGEGAIVRLYQRDFITPLIDLWGDHGYAVSSVRSIGRHVTEPIYAVKPLPKGYYVLRDRQKEAVTAALHKMALVVGPPGTGKSFTVGAVIAYLLTRFKNSRLLLVGPTNGAVDTALLAADDWLERLGKTEFRDCMKRVGSRFDVKKYRDRPHLLAKGASDFALQVAILELEEPPRADVVKYAEWKVRMDRARADLRSDITALAEAARMVALTTASLFIWHEAIRLAGPWNFVLCDEASQVFAPSALMLTTFASQAIFAGDPQQLSPVVQCPSQGARGILAQTAFDVFKGAKRIQLNEQSRMCSAISGAVGSTFYSGDLHVCRKASSDPEWQKARAAYFVGGRRTPRIVFDDRADEPKWSQKYNGFIRYFSAKLVEAYVAEFLGSYADPKDILVLTPFRAQRAMLRTFFSRDSLREVRVSTVHKSQGSESKIVIFDPVDAHGPFVNSPDGRRLINVALSRAQAHAIFIVNRDDLANPCLRELNAVASRMQHDDRYHSKYIVNVIGA